MYVLMISTGLGEVLTSGRFGLSLLPGIGLQSHLLLTEFLQKYNYIMWATWIGHAIDILLTINYTINGRTL